MLFLQGTRDALAALDQIEPLCKELGARATLKLYADADHSFHVPAKPGGRTRRSWREMLDAFLPEWIGMRDAFVNAKPGAQSKNF